MIPNYICTENIFNCFRNNGRADTIWEPIENRRIDFHLCTHAHTQSKRTFEGTKRTIPELPHNTKQQQTNNNHQVLKQTNQPT